ncbi:hypothetical protein BDZ94DRAFT_1302288 [Collybia nuda]|uniref:Uncharacterized protein n=1 Tax=Collybia nuda TaxID=64659 RepID=A0A9P5XW70_9AGAR|nr:hypothetical protein BDZ94DRAFT_1302288 [Collybia nuda]
MAISDDSNLVARKHRSDSERKEELSSDPWIDKWNNKQVVCKGCGKTLRLDQRREWYTFSWRKHKASCSGIPDAEGRCGAAKRKARRVERESRALGAVREAAKLHLKKKSIPRRSICPAAARKVCVNMKIKVDVDVDTDVGDTESVDEEVTEDEAQLRYEWGVEDRPTEEDLAAAWILIRMKHNAF